MIWGGLFVSETITLSELSAYRSLLDMLYDTYRIVDPEQKKVLAVKQDQLYETGQSCFAALGRSMPCDNCVSCHSNTQEKSSIKILSLGTCIYIVWAVPITGEARTLSLELMKNITDNLINDSPASPDGQGILNAVSELNDMVVRDHLTGLYNRRYIDDRLASDVSRARERQGPLSIIFIDVDRFKHINDTYGHETGDLVLQATGKAIGSCIRTEGDWAARYGGDEFLICLSGADTEQARVVSSRILTAVAGLCIPADADVIGITISIGIHTTIKGTQTAEDILRAADKNMYESKHSGKNRVTATAD